MSALDQAFLKAYAKDSQAPPCTAARPQPAPLPVRSAQTIEQLYHDGALYRIETPAPPPWTTQAVPAPHLPQTASARLCPPPTSPRRGVRRSLLRLLASQANREASNMPPAPPRVARKVIIRHIPHSAPSAPLGLLRPILNRPHTPREEDVARTDAAAIATFAELPPETIADEPFPAELLPAEPLPTPPLPSGPLAPQIAPLNKAPEFCPPIAVHGHWEAAAGAQPLVIVAEPAELTQSAAPAVLTVHLDAFPVATDATNLRRGAEPANADDGATSFAGKSLDDVDGPPVKLRVDPPHANANHRPHVSFAASEAEDRSSHEQIPAEEANALAAPLRTAIELTLAESLDEPLASDLIPVEGSTDATRGGRQPAAKVEPSPSARKPALPLWEVDRFHWPTTCERLLADESGYFSHAGERLLAAVRDGLKVLAITGSRRGEGRTTLALCLARTAAAAGIQVAMLDADFARPQLATKIGLEIAFSWQDAALGKVPLSEAAIKSLADNITVLPLEASAAGRSLSLADPRVTATIRAAAATFELLILDLGPLGPGEEIAFPPGEACPLDAAIVVRDLRFATATESDSIGHRLQDAGVEAVGIAENFVVEEEAPVASL